MKNRYSSSRTKILIGSLSAGLCLGCFSDTWGGTPPTSSPRISNMQQQNVVKGTVVDQNGEPLIGVSVIVVGGTTGVITDLDGNFSITVTGPKATLKFSYVGYKDYLVKVKQKSHIEVVMEEDNQILDEVVVVGYGTQKKISSTAAVVSVNNKELLQSPTSSVANALVGRMPGLTAIQTSGLPGGDSPILRVRGITTLSSGYESEPLVLVDGIERPFDQLDPNEIESISVLKDASSTAVFGVRGANGVIIVTTRRGEEGKPKVSWTSDVSIQTPINVPDMLTSGDYAALYNEAQHNDGIAGKFEQWQIDAYHTNSNPILYPSIDWFDYLLKDFSIKTQHNMNVSGGTKNIKYFISLGYLYQDGLWKAFQTKYNNNSTYNRYNFRSNFDISLTKTTTFKVGIGGRIEERHHPNTDLDKYFALVYECPPNSSAGIVDDKVILHNAALGPKREPFTAIATSGYRQNMSSTLNLNLDLIQKLDAITKGLSAHITFAYDSYYAFNQTHSASIPKYYVDRDIADINGDGIQDPYIIFQKNGEEGPMGYSTSYGKNRKMYFSGSLNYNRTFNEKHNISALALYNQNKDWYPANIGMTEIPRAYLGMVGRVTYDFGHRYLAEFNIGYNGSENFPEGKRFGWFPAYSIGYVLSEEPFMKNMQKIMSYFKLKASYGKVGNDKVGSGYRFLYMPSPYSWGGSTWFGQDATSFGGVVEGKVGNPYVTWEVAYKENYALESKWFDSRLTFNFDYFRERRSNILTTRKTIPAHIAATFQPGNIGKVNSHGYELELGWRDNIGDLNYSIRTNYSFTRNKIIEFDEVKRQEEWLNQTGNRVGQYYGLICTGIFNSPEQLTDPNLPTYPAGTPQLGDLIYLDYNEDGKIDYKDVLPIGYSRYPEITYGINLGAQYKGVSISILFQGTENVSNYYSGDVRQPFRNDASAFTYHLGRWTPETSQSASYPRVTEKSGHNNYVGLGNVSSSYWLKDASYLRLKNIEVSYSFKSLKLQKTLGVNNIRIYASGNNLFTWSKLKIFDPESEPGGPYKYPQLSTYNLGVNLQF